MAKLSKAQAKLLEELKNEIDKARRLSYPEWLAETQHYFATPAWADERLKKVYEERLQKAVEEKYFYEYWEERRNAIVNIHCNSKTLKKLEELGLIEIIYDSTGSNYGIDEVKVLNY